MRKKFFKPGMGLRERLMIETYPEPNTGCWLWAGSVNSRNYGMISATLGGKRRGILAHRLSFELFNNAIITPGYSICHKCNNKICINPDHLYEGTHSDNIQQAYRDGLMKGKTKPVIQMSLDGDAIARYESATLAAEDTGLRVHQIRYACNNDLKFCRDYNWKYE